MPFSKEIVKVWYGVEIPEWLRAFDCRQDESNDLPKSSWGITLYSSEKAEVDLGLFSERENHSTIPQSCRTYIDSRSAHNEELTRQVKDMIRTAETMKLEYDKAKASKKNSPHGGSTCYMPVAITMSNFGWSVIADKRISATKWFQ